MVSHYLHILVESIVEDQRVCECEPVWLHRVALAWGERESQLVPLTT